MKRIKIKSSLPFHAVWVVITLFIMMGGARIEAEEVSYMPKPFRCEVRYYYRDGKERTNSGAKLPFKSETLGEPKALLEGKRAIQRAEGFVKHCPYYVLIQYSRQNEQDTGEVAIILLDAANREKAPGYPLKIKNADKELKEGVDFKIDVGKIYEQRIQEELIKKAGSFDHVSVWVGYGK